MAKQGNECEQTYESAKESVRASGGEPIATKAHGGIVCKPVRGVEYARFNEGVTKAITKQVGTVFDAQRRLVMSCLVYPDAETARAIFDKAPLLVETLANGIQRVSGGEEELEGN